MDYDDDGMLDLVVGDRDGFIHHYRRTSESPITLTQEVDLVCDTLLIDVGYNAAPCIVDWDEDGEIDLLLGNETGKIRLYINDTIDTDPVWNSYTFIENSGSPISHYRNCPQVYDMNMDGRKDILVGENSGLIYYYENTGTNEDPAFSGNELIISTGDYGARIWVNDWNEDGLPDIIASGYYGFIEVYLQEDPLSVEEGETPVVRTLSTNGNPFAGSVVLSANGFSNGTISIYDVLGRIVLSESFNGSFEWDTSEVSNGCYFAEVTDSEGSSTVRLLKL